MRPSLEVDLWEISIVTFPDAARRAHRAVRRRLGPPSDARRPCGRPTHLIRHRAKDKHKDSDASAATRTMPMTPRPADIPASGDDCRTRAFDEFMPAFEAFKDANDRRLAELEKRGSADVLTVEKVDRISMRARRAEGAIDALALKGCRPQLERRRPAQRRRTQGSVQRLCARGEERRPRADEGGVAAADGGYLVPNETETEIGRRLTAAVADPRHRRRAPGVGGGLQEAVLGDAARRSAGSARRRHVRRPTTPTLAELSSRRWSSTPCRRRPRRCSTIRRSTSTSGSPSEVEAAFAEQEGHGLRLGRRRSTSRRVSSTTPRSLKRAGLGADRLCRDWRVRRTAGERCHRTS